MRSPETWPFEVYFTPAFEQFGADQWLFVGQPQEPEGVVFEEADETRTLSKAGGSPFSAQEVQWMLDPLRMHTYFKLDQSLNTMSVEDKGSSYIVSLVAAVDDGHINHVVIGIDLVMAHTTV